MTPANLAIAQTAAQATNSSTVTELKASNDLTAAQPKTPQALYEIALSLLKDIRPAQPWRTHYFGEIFNPVLDTNHPEARVILYVLRHR